MKIGNPVPPVLPAPAREAIRHAPADRRDNSRTFGFDELGVFGLRPDPALSHARDREQRFDGVEPEPLAAGIPGDGQPTPVAMAPGAPVPLAQPSPRSEPTAPVLDTSEDRHPVPELRPNLLDGGGGAPEAASVDAANAGPTEESAPAMRPRPVAASRNEYSLLVSVNEGRVSIALGGPPLDGEGRALLRRLVRELLVGRRLSLADFQLNGVPLGADFLAGDIHGPRSR